MAEPIAKHDELRKLVEFGVEQVHDTSRWFINQYPDMCFDLAIVSPYERAQQTFNIVNQHVPILKTMISSDVKPDGEPSIFHEYLLALLDTVNETKSVKSILLVSHMPFVSLFLEKLLYDTNAPLFNTGAIAVVQCNRQTLKGNLEELYQSIL